MKKVLVTAGASGIGLAISRAFHAAGSQVYMCDINEDGMARAASGMQGLLTRRCDIGSREDIAAMVADATTRLGGLDVLVNNAGIGGPTRPVQDLDPADWDAVLKVNVTGAFDVTRLAIPHLIRSRGAIINMASAAGRYGYANRSPYSASKWALIGLTKTLSMELGEHGIRVNAIAPGAVAGARAEAVYKGRMEATGQTLEEVKRAAMAGQSLKYLVDPADIAALAVFLASDAARSISGQVLPIDGDMQRA